MESACDIHALLEDLENRLDPAEEDRCEALWRDFFAGKNRKPLFSPKRSRPNPPRCEWPRVELADILGPDQFDAMAAEQLGQVSAGLAGGWGASLAVRPNYGVATLASLFGVEIVPMERHLNLLPTCRALAGGAAALEALLDAPPPPLESGLGGQVFGVTRRYLELFRDYPKVRKYVRLYHPDLQGPMDVLELVWGSDMFVGFYDEPELAQRLLERITETYGRFLEAWLALVQPPEGIQPHWGYWWPATLVLRDDSAMNLSPEMYRDFALPWNRRLVERFGGGSIHACGRVDHWLPVAAEIPGLKAFNMSQPQYNDMEIVWRNTVDKGIAVVAMPQSTADAALAAGRDLRGLVHILV